MNIDIKEFQKNLQLKKQLLDNAVIQLKKEFIGLDTVIDQVAQTSKSWLYFSDMQDRPTIINLWGLTGIGKTSLVNRFMELMNLSNCYYRFDLGESSNSNVNMQDKFKNIYENSENNFVLGFDEFQLARTIDEEGKEINKPTSRAIWDLLDSGKFDLVEFSIYYIGTLLKIIKKLNKALTKGVIVENGIVVEKIDEYTKLFQKSDDDDDEDDEDEPSTQNKDKEVVTKFFPSNYTYILFNLDLKKYLGTFELDEFLSTLNGEETIQYLVDVYNESMKPKKIDCSKSLIFVLGNLDEVYSMSQNFNPDISADEFHKDSLKISITQVKNSLLSRFRSEQIARLGNNHIIYPSFDSSSFKQIINLELKKITDRIVSRYDVELIYDDSFKELIYTEGVYPTQGTRPIFTTIQQMVSGKLGDILSIIFVEGHLSKSVILRTDNVINKENYQNVIVDFYDNNKKLIYTYQYDQLLALGKLRKEKRNDQQAITAVHESGHATLSAILLKTLSTAVISVTADNNSLGFTLSRTEWNYVTKGEIIRRIAVLLGGLEAERLIFGEEFITIGASHDIQNATKLATYVIYNCGFGESSAFYGNSSRDVINTIYDTSSSEVNKVVKDLLDQGKKLAYEVLQQQKILLLKMSDHLSDHRSLDKKQLRTLIETYAVEFNMDSIVEDAETIYYRHKLKEDVKSEKIK